MPTESLDGTRLSPELRRLATLLGSKPRYRTCFISHTSADLVFATRLRDALLTRGVPEWSTPVDSQVEFNPAKDATDRDLLFHLNAFIDTAACTLLVLSAAAQRSHWVAKEVERASAVSGREGAFLFALTIDEATTAKSFAYTTPSTRIIDGKIENYQQRVEYRFDDKYWVDFRTPDAHNFEQALSILMRTLVKPGA
jgi:hypothetical protein